MISGSAPESGIGVVGGGIMGSGIALLCATEGLEVVLCEKDDASVRAAEQRSSRQISRLIRDGTMEESASEIVRSSISWTTQLRLISECEIIIEAVPEDVATKREVFRELDGFSPHSIGILASNTSSIPISNLASQTSFPERVVGMHFFHPVYALPLVELSKTLLTSKVVVEQAKQFLQDDLQRSVVICDDRAGLIVNRLLVPYLLAAIRMLDSGFASKEDIDLAMRRGANHSLGPLSIADSIGLDTLKSVAESLYSEYRESMYAPPPLLDRMVASGHLGRKSGKGFYDYP